MDFKNVTLYPELIIDIVVYVLVGVALVVFSKWIWEWKEERRLRKEMQEYYQRKEDEE
ncbi:MAG: hypothetical protein IJA77_01910 [Clostridia bacterium]|nr:hypothetical protein [Clostridia bacterium]